MSENPVKTTSVDGMELSKEEFDQLSSAGKVAQEKRRGQKQAPKAEEAEASKAAGKKKAKEDLNNKRWFQRTDDCK